MAAIYSIYSPIFHMRKRRRRTNKKSAEGVTEHHSHVRPSKHQMHLIGCTTHNRNAVEKNAICRKLTTTTTTTSRNEGRQWSAIHTHIEAKAHHMNHFYVCVCPICLRTCTCTVQINCLFRIWHCCRCCYECMILLSVSLCLFLAHM